MDNEIDIYDDFVLYEHEELEEMILEAQKHKLQSWYVDLLNKENRSKEEQYKMDDYFYDDYYYKEIESSIGNAYKQLRNNLTK